MTGQTILLVDDNTELLELLSLALTGAGYVVQTARTVLRAVEMLHDGTPPPALIVTDLVMPRTTGWDLLKHLRDDANLRRVPIIVVSGADVGEGESLADVVLTKPIDPLELVGTVERLLAHAHQA
jgi:CheY-like chemotaxis protein